MPMKDRIRSELLKDGFTEEGADLRLKNGPVRLLLIPVILVSGLILLVFVVALFSDYESEEPVRSFLFLVGSGAAFFFSVKTVITQFKAEELLRHKADSEQQVTQGEPPPQVETSNIQKPWNEPTNPAPEAHRKEGVSTISIVAVGLGLASIVMPYFAAVLFVPATFICGVIAFRQGDRMLGGIALVMATIGMLHIVNVSDQLGEAQKDLERSLRSLN